MPKIVLTWKDPDWYDAICHGKQELTDDQQKVFFETAAKAGLGEYLDIEFDTDTGIATILGGQ